MRLHALGLVVATIGCGRIGFDDMLADGVCQSTVVAGTGTQDITLCAGTSLLAIDAVAGALLTISIEPRAAPAQTSLELRTPDDAWMAGPVWTPTAIETTALVTIDGAQQLRVDAEVDTEATITVQLVPPAGRVLHLALDGDDTRDGSATQPWRTWAVAIAALQAGDTLIVHDGTWSEAAGEVMPRINCMTGASNGMPDRRITVIAQHSRRAHLAGDGSFTALHAVECSYWTFDGLRVSLADLAGVGAGDGTPVQFINTPHVIARNLLLEKPNRCGNHQVLVVSGLLSVNALVEDSEVYAFHRNALVAFGSPSVTFRRNYEHSRDTPGLPCSIDGNPTRGDSGTNCYGIPPDGGCRVENNLAENVVVGVDDADSASLHVHDSIALDAFFGIYVGSVPATPIVRTEPVRVDDFVCLNCDMGIWNRGVQLEVDRATLAGGRPRADVSYGQGAVADERGGTTATTVFRDVVAIDNTRAGFNVAGQASFRIERGIAFGNNLAFENDAAAETPSDAAGNVVDSHVLEPTLVGDRDGSCLVYVPSGSNLTTQGAQITHRVVDGVVTERKLWNQRTGQFPCGAIVPGVNDVPGASCFDVHQRLRVGVAGCAIP